MPARVEVGQRAGVDHLYFRPPGAIEQALVDHAFEHAPLAVRALHVGMDDGHRFLQLQEARLALYVAHDR